MSERMKSRIGLILAWISIAIFLWMVISFFEVNAKNLTDQSYSAWNFFKIIR